MTEEEMIERGKEMYERCYGGLFPLPRNVEPDAHSGLSLKMFADFWGDERLPFRDKRLIVMAVSAALGAAPAFEMHARCALRNGELEPDELRSAALMMLPYVGYPRMSSLLYACDKLIAEHEKND